MTHLCFVDTETTGLDPDQHEIWEIAIIRRDADGIDWESHYQLRKTELHLAQAADEKALEISRYHERMIVPEDCGYAQIDGTGKPCAMSYKTLIDDLNRLLTGAVIVGSNPAFDVAFLRTLMNAAPWHYRTIDIATLAAGYRYGQAASGAYGGDFLFPGDYPTHPYSSRGLSRAVGVQPPGSTLAHTALGDAHWARDVYDAITKAQP
jgi:DNA polymerase III epsilon subunit-like protein